MDQRVQFRIQLLFVSVIVVLLLLGGYRAYLNFKAQRDITIGRTNMLNLYKALANYVQDWDRLPPAQSWTDLVRGYLTAPPNTPGGAESYLHGPADTGMVGYVYNDLAAGYNLEPTNKNDRQKTLDPSNLVLLVEKVGAEENASIHIPTLREPEGEQALQKSLSFPHFADDKERAASLVLLANGRIVLRTRRDFR
jgi:hypothetical protein